MKKNKIKIGLALSGGGYRAAAYHIGTLKKLHQLGILEKIDIISCISGGAILGAFYGLHKDNFENFEKKAKQAVKKNVIGAVLTSVWFYIALAIIIITSYITLKLHTMFFIIWLFILWSFQFKSFPISKLIIKAYDKFFFDNCTLSDLPQQPIIAINSTNLESGRPFTFSLNKMSDSFYEYPPNKTKAVAFKPKAYPISNAVMASTCVPFAFSPIKIPSKYFEDKSDYSRVSPLLIDGGVYDNQGIHKLTQKGSSYECDYIIVSDAGSNNLSSNNINNQFKLLFMTVELLMNRIKNFQMSQNLYTPNRCNKRVAYQSLHWRVESCIEGFYSNLLSGKIPQVVWEYHKITDEEIEQKNKIAIISKIKESVNYQSILKISPNEEEYTIANSVSTNLWSLKERQVESLIKCASAITEIQIKLYLPNLIK